MGEFKLSALLYDGHDTFKLNQEQRDALVAVRLIRYEPEHGPNGIMYVPRKGWSAQQVMNQLVR